MVENGNNKNKEYWVQAVTLKEMILKCWKNLSVKKSKRLWCNFLLFYVMNDDSTFVHHIQKKYSMSQNLWSSK